MKFVTQIILIALAAYVLELFLPWYSIAIAAFLVSIFVRSSSNFFAGFLAIGILWFAAAWIIDHNSASDLTSRVSGLFKITNTMLLMIATAFIGALVAGFAAVAGASLQKEKRRY